jgi:hypothetical protein
MEGTRAASDGGIIPNMPAPNNPIPAVPVFFIKDLRSIGKVLIWCSSCFSVCMINDMALQIYNLKRNYSIVVYKN